MADLFTEALVPVLVHEGGKVDDKRDPGGRTNQGVIQRVYDSYRSQRGRPRQDVFLMTVDERNDIYRAQYWDRIQGDRLPRGVGYVVFDGAVNSGVGQSAKWLQRALGLTGAEVDGVVGEKTLQLVAEFGDMDRLIALICGRRLIFLQALKTWKTFGKGWSTRVRDVQMRGQKWAVNAPAPVALFTPDAETKATIADAPARPGTGVADAATGGGVATGGLGGVLDNVRDQLSPYASVSDWVAKIVTILIIVGIVATAGGLAYSFIQKRRAAARADALDIPTAAPVLA